jgi:SAM-dependent methyltransferase
MIATRILAIPGVYDCFQFLAGGVRCRKTYVERHLRPAQGEKVLDIGCGTGDMLRFFPEVEYHGFDPSPAYIAKARLRRFPNSHFTCGLVTEQNLGKSAYFDLGHSSGVLHHLNDSQAIELLRVAFQALRPGGRFCTLDGCFYPGQSRLSRWVLRRDRGKYVRDENEYLTLAKQVFPNVASVLYPNLLRPLPYPVLVMEMSKS